MFINAKSRYLYISPQLSSRLDPFVPAAECSSAILPIASKSVEIVVIPFSTIFQGVSL
jgi:hypothetical protein